MPEKRRPKLSMYDECREFVVQENGKIKLVKFERLPIPHLLIRRLALVVSQNQGFQHEVTLVEEGAAHIIPTSFSIINFIRRFSNMQYPHISPIIAAGFFGISCNTRIWVTNSC
jgi:hypothetical protein